MNNNKLLEQLPLFIGITGHRDLIPSSISQLEIEIKKTLFAIKTELSPNTPQVLVSGLAEGADRLAAKLALDLRLNLLVVLPMKLEIYLEDFTSNISKEEFLDLLKKANQVITLNNVDNVEDARLENEQYRNKQYEQLAKFLAKNCYYIIALWDGEVTNYKGGTSAVVSIKLNGLIDDRNLNFDRIEIITASPIFLIDTPRVKNPNIKISSFKKVYPYKWKNEQDARVFFDLIISRLNRYNDDLKRISHKKRESEFISSELKELQNVFADNVLIVKLINYLASNDNLAKYYQGFRVKFLKMILVGLVFASLFFNLYLEVWRYPVILGLYLLALLIVTTIYVTLKQKFYEHKHQDYRIVAEALRVQLYWEISGIDKNAWEFLFNRCENDTMWISYVLRTSPLSLNKFTNGYKDFCKNESERLNIVYDDWIRGQSVWFQNKAKQNLLKSIKYEKIANRMFLGGILLTVILFILETLQINIIIYEYFLNAEFNSILIILSIMLMTISATFLVFKEKMVFREQADNYVRMGNLFENAKRQFDATSDISERQKVIFEIGKEVIKDTENWLVYNRLRPIEINKG
jgi:hypothetical protein